MTDTPTEAPPPYVRPWKSDAELEALFAPLGFEHCACPATGGCWRWVTSKDKHERWRLVGTQSA